MTTVEVEWRSRGYPAIPCIEKETPSGEWTTYKLMSKKEADAFLQEFNALGENRTMFQYRIKP